MLTILFCIRLFGCFPTHYDNFTHWTLVIRDLLKNNRLPTFQSELIIFQGYPTGSAGFIYYVCRLIGDSESAMLMGQMIILISCIIPFLAFIRKYTISSCLTVFIASIYLLCANIVVTELLVDSLLAFLAIAQFAVIVYYQDDIQKASICSCIIGCYLSIVKSSGMFFVILHGLFPLFIAVFAQHRKLSDFLKDKEHRKALLLNFLPPALLYLLWNRHVKLVFKHGLGSKLSMTPQIFYHSMREKGVDGFLEVTGIFLRRIITPGTEWPTLLLLAVILLLLLTGLKNSKSRFLSSGSFAVWCLGVYGCYLLGLLAMYLFSMSYWEALGLGGFNRYLSTITMYLAGISVVYFLIMVPDPASFIRAAFPVLLCGLLLTRYSFIPTVFYGCGSDKYPAAFRTALNELKTEYNIEDGSSCCMVIQDTSGYNKVSSGYYDFLLRYTFWSEEITIQPEPDADELSRIAKNYDYLIVMNPTNEVTAFLEQNGLPAGEAVYPLKQ